MTLPVFDAAAGNKVTSATTNTFNHTVSAVQTNEILLVVVDAGASISSVTYNGVSLTFLGSVAVGGGETLAMWYLLSPPTGTHSVVITTSGSTYIIGASASYYNVAQSGIFGTLASNTGNSAASSNSPVTTSTNQLVIDVVNNTSPSTDTPTASQTKREQPATSGVAIGDIAATGSTMSLTWSFTSSGWAALSVAMNGIISGGGVTHRIISDGLGGVFS